MIIISSRKDFSDPDALETHGHKIKKIDLRTDRVDCDLTEDELLNEVSGKTVLLLVHGYNNEQDEVHDAYTIIDEKVSEHTGNKYDLVIGYSWPGGDMGIEWYSSKQRANSVARRFRFLISLISKSTNSIDLMSHSLGARVVLKALKQASNEKLIRNYFCMAAAIDNEVLEMNEEFHLSINKVEQLYIFHSRRDGVLSGVYRLAEWDNALGLYGPEDKAYIQNRTKTIYVANCKKVVDSHGGYKRCDAVYKYIDKVIEKTPTKFVTL